MSARTPSPMSEIAQSVQQELNDVKTELSPLKVDIARVDAETRVTKHDVSNLRYMFSGLGVRLDRLDEKLTGKLEPLSDQFNGLNLKQERGLGSFAGMASDFTIAGGCLFALRKVLNPWHFHSAPATRPAMLSMCPLSLIRMGTATRKCLQDFGLAHRPRVSCQPAENLPQSWRREIEEGSYLGYGRTSLRRQ